MIKSVLLDRIWFEVYDAKLKEVYLSQFLARRSRVRSILDVLIVFVSVIGAVLYQFSGLVTLFSVMIAALLSLIACCVPAIVPRESDISAISKVVSFYTDYVSTLERLYIHLYDGSVTPEAAETEFYRIRDAVPSVESAVNTFLHRNIRRFETAAVRAADIYIENVFKSI